MKTWHVHRDGHRWSVPAASLAEALLRACMRTDSMTGQQYVDAGTKRERFEAPPPEEPPIALHYLGDQIEAVHHVDGETTVHVVNLGLDVSHDFACEVLERSRARFAAAQRESEASTVKDASGAPVEVHFYRSGERALTVGGSLGQAGKLERGVIKWSCTGHMHRLLEEFERDGLIKWPRSTSAAAKTRTLEGVVHNAKQLEYVRAMQSVLVDSTELACESCVPRPKPLDELDESGLRARRDSLTAELGALTSTAAARHEVNARIAAVDRRLDIFDSIRSHGFDVGAVVDVLPAPWDDEQITRRARVIEVVVEHKQTYFGNEPDTQHRRAVEYFDGHERSQPETDRLRSTI